MKFLFKMQQFLFFALHHLVHGDTCPAAHNIGNVIGADLLFYEGFLALHGLKLGLYCGILLLFLVDARVAYLSHLRIVAFTLGTIGLEVELLYVDSVLVYAVDQFLLGFPLSGDLLPLLPHLGEIFFDFTHLLLVALSRLIASRSISF